MNTINTGFREAKPLLIPAAATIDLLLVGTGGTGSWLAPHLARVTRALLDSGKSAHLTFIDPDVVEEPNLVRQNFCDAEVGAFKSATLALRYSAAWHVPIDAVTAPFTPEMLPLPLHRDRVALVIGAVDNAPARLALHDLLQHNRADLPPLIYYLDIGNGKERGQCLLGTAYDLPRLRDAFKTPGICAALPSPLLQDPTLGEARPEERAEQGNLSCAELVALNYQSPAINAVMASIAAEYVWALLVKGGLKRFATFVTLRLLTMASSWTNPKEVAASVDHLPGFFTKTTRRRSA